MRLGPASTTTPLQQRTEWVKSRLSLVEEFKDTDYKALVLTGISIGDLAESPFDNLSAWDTYFTIKEILRGMK